MTAKHLHIKFDTKVELPKELYMITEDVRKTHIVICEGGNDYWEHGSLEKAEQFAIVKAAEHPGRNFIIFKPVGQFFIKT